MTRKKTECLLLSNTGCTIALFNQTQTKTQEALKLGENYN